MNTAEHQALAQARARIEQNLSEIASLARDSRLAPSEFFARFLALTLESVDAMGGAVWSIDQGQANRVAEVSFASSGYKSARQKLWIDQLLAHTVATAKACVVAVQEQPPAGENARATRRLIRSFIRRWCLTGRPGWFCRSGSSMRATRVITRTSRHSSRVWLTKPVSTRAASSRVRCSRRMQKTATCCGCMKR